MTVALKIVDGRIAAVGTVPAMCWQERAPDETVIDHRGKLILPGFVDTHVHYPQAEVIASYGAQLLDWLDDYTFPAEAAFADPAHARRTSPTSSSMSCCATAPPPPSVYCTVHPQSVDAFFEAARARATCA